MNPNYRLTRFNDAKDSLLIKLLFVIFFKNVIVVFVQNVETAFYFGLIEFIIFNISYFTLKKHSSWFFDAFYLFIILFFFYNSFYVFYTMIFDDLLFKYSSTNILLAYKISTFTTSGLYIAYLLKEYLVSNFSESNVREINYKNYISLFDKRINEKNFLIFTIVINILVFPYIRNFFDSGGWELFSAYDRNTTRRLLGDGDFWFIKGISIGYTFFLVLFYSIKLKERSLNNLLKSVIGLLLNGSVVLFWVIHIGIGNRREILYLILLIVGLMYIILHRKINPKKISFFLLTLFFFFIIIGVSRNNVSIEDLDVRIKFLTGFGEFIFPYKTLLHYVSSDSLNFKFGFTYFYLFYFFIPRSVWLSKPYPLGHSFVQEISAKQGYGFMPITESYLNFGFLSIVILPFLILCFFRIFYNSNKKFPFLYLMLIMQAPVLNRSEISVSIVEIINIYLPFYFMYKLVFVNKKNKL